MKENSWWTHYRRKFPYFSRKMNEISQKNPILYQNISHHINSNDSAISINFLQNFWNKNRILTSTTNTSHIDQAFYHLLYSLKIESNHELTLCSSIFFHHPKNFQNKSIFCVSHSTTDKMILFIWAKFVSWIIRLRLSLDNRQKLLKLLLYQPLETDFSVDVIQKNSHHLSLL